jgi:hypothetical protein
MKKGSFRLIAVCLAVIGFAPIGMEHVNGADGTAQLGVDPRTTSGTASQNFGFAFMENVQYTAAGTTGFTDTCQTTGSGSAQLIAMSAAASPENDDAIMATCSGSTATFAGRTGDCYYMVAGKSIVPSTGHGSVPAGPAPWSSAFDTATGGHFVVYINNRDSATDDIFVIGDPSMISTVSVELVNDTNPESVAFSLSQSGDGTISLLGSDGTPASSGATYYIQPGSTVTVNAVGLNKGNVTITASAQ